MERWFSLGWKYSQRISSHPLTERWDLVVRKQRCYQLRQWRRSGWIYDLPKMLKPRPEVASLHSDPLFFGRCIQLQFGKTPWDTVDFTILYSRHYITETVRSVSSYRLWLLALKRLCLTTFSNFWLSEQLFLILETLSNFWVSEQLFLF